MAAVVADTLHATPDDGSTHWIMRWRPVTASARTRWPASGGTTSSSRGGSRRSRSPTTPFFEDKLVDVVALYMDPPERAVVFSFDEKTQVQARTAPSRRCPCARDEPAR